MTTTWTSAGTITIAAGECRDAGNTMTMRASAMAKRIYENWSAGSGAGGFPSGLTLTSAETYHLFCVDTSAGTIDYCFDSAVTATNALADTGGTHYQMVWSNLTDTALDIIPYDQDGDVCTWRTPIQDVNDSSPGTSEKTATVSVPTGIACKARFNMSVHGSKASTNQIYNNVYAHAPDVTNSAPSNINVPGSSGGLYAQHTGISAGTFSVQNYSQIELTTNTSAQIDYRGGNDIDYFGLFCLEFTHPRGRNL